METSLSTKVSNLCKEIANHPGDPEHVIFPGSKMGPGKQRKAGRHYKPVHHFPEWNWKSHLSEEDQLPAYSHGPKVQEKGVQREGLGFAKRRAF